MLCYDKDIGHDTRPFIYDKLSRTIFYETKEENVRQCVEFVTLAI